MAESTESTKSYDDQETKARQTQGVNSNSLAESGDPPMRDNYDGDDGSDGMWEDVSDQEIDVNLDEMVELIREELGTKPDGDPARVELLNALGNVLFDRYLGTRVLNDLNEAIQVARQVINAVPDDHPERSDSLNTLGIRLGERYSRSEAMADLNEAMQIMRQVVDNLSPGGLEPAGVLHNLGMLLGLKFSRTRDADDLEEAIQVTRRAVNTTPIDHPDWVSRVISLGVRLHDRYSSLRTVCDLEEALQLARRALQEAPDDHPDYPGLLTNLGALLGDKYSRTAEASDLEEAIGYRRKAVDVTPSDHPRRAMLLSNLGNHLGRRYSRTGATADLEEAIQLSREAVRITPDDDSWKAGYLNSLGLQLGERYLGTGAMADLDEAIECVQQAVNRTPEDHPEWAIYMNNLAGILGDRYWRIGALADLEEAIRILRQAIAATPENHPHSAKLLANLGNHLSSRYSRTKAEADLEEAIHYIRRSLDSEPEDQESRMVHLDMLAVLLGKRYSETQAIVDLKEAIRVAREAVDEAPEDHAYRARVLNNLGDELGNLYERTRDTADLEEAITYLRQAVEIMPQDYPDRSAPLGNLGEQLNRLYTKTESIEDRQGAIAYYQAALNQANSYTLSRIWAGRGVLRCAPDWQQAYEAAKLTVGLVPKLSSRSLQNTDRKHALSQVVGLASDAAAVALQAGQTPLVALGLLEQGRGVLGTSLEELRTDVLSLRDREPELAKEFVRLRDELEAAATQNLQLEGRSLETSWQARASRRYEAGKDFDELVAKIQRLPGFEDFLLPPTEAEIKAAARCGPIVVINVSKYRCDALLVEPHQIRALALTQLSIEEVERKARGGDLDSYEVLEWLWDNVTQPILDALGFAQPPSSGSWPRGHVVLCLPVKALIHGRRRRLQPATSSKVLLVAMKHTPGNDSLPFAPEEAAMLWELCKSMPLQAVEPERRKQDVESHLRDCKIFHFAGHGATDEYDASNSRLILEDGPLRVAELLDMNLVERSPFLAYLSACGTGRIKDETSVDESIHLMGAFQLAGFRHVIGTLWEVRDELCVDMARITYEGMRDGGMTDASVCRGLHHASRTLRDQCFGRSESEDESFPAERNIPGTTSGEKPKGAQSSRDISAVDTGLATWAPYIHLGV
ncbi:hypothetical protein DL770_010513 [Monosporascus sp. CRB-9-2]|nr:hypothetical protein DL770_010513 [Monosporascus sp. CRB-9-2]